MEKIRLGRTNITVNKNGFGALPIQRVSKEEAKKILLKAYDHQIDFFDTARAYTDSEEKIGYALNHVRHQITIATKTQAQTPGDFWQHLEASLVLLNTDYIDIYQFHNPATCFKPSDGTGMYEAMAEAKKQGKIRFIGLTNHRLNVAQEAICSALYDTLQFPFSYLAGDEEINLVKQAKKSDMGFIAMKALSGGLITDSKMAAAFLNSYDSVLPIWGIQREKELDEFISYQDHAPLMDQEMTEKIMKDKAQLSGDFCRGCGYCLPCPAEIEIPTSARMSLLLRRAVAESFLTEQWQEKMSRIDNCIGCNHCVNHCPYGLNTPELLKTNYADYKTFMK